MRDGNEVAEMSKNARRKDAPATFDRPLFRTIGEALIWAWYSAPARASTVNPSSVVSMISEDNREQVDGEKRKRSSDSFMFDRKPNGYSAAAQAGLIKGYVSRLPRDECCHIMAAYLRGRERARARRVLTGIILSYIDEGWERRRLVLRLIAKHYGKPGIHIDDLAERYRVKGGRRAVTAIYREVVIMLDAVGYRAEMRVGDYLQEQRVIQ